MPRGHAPVPATSTATASKADGQDLISRYNLSARIGAESEESQPPASSSAWAQNKEERQRLLQKRRDEMILAARRKMMEKGKGPAL